MAFLAYLQYLWNVAR